MNALILDAISKNYMYFTFYLKDRFKALLFR